MEVTEAKTADGQGQSLLAQAVWDELFSWRPSSPYRKWSESQGLPIHRGYYVEDLRDLAVAYWPERECNAAFLELTGQEGVTEVRLTEIAAGNTLPPVTFALDEIVYVVEGRGLTRVWAEGKTPQTFEWQPHSMFLLPRTHSYQLANLQGEKPARLLHYNYLPIAMWAHPDPGFFFNNPYGGTNLLGEGSGEFYAEARVVESRLGNFGVWNGNFFPDMGAWDRLGTQRGRGVASQAIRIRFPQSTMCGHMSVFQPRTYKKAHRHGPGYALVIPAGAGYCWRP